MVRKTSDLTLLKTFIPGLDGINLVYGDLTNIESLRKNFISKHIVFNIAGVNTGPTQLAYDSVNVTGNKNVCDALLDVNPNVKRVIIISSLACAGPSTLCKPKTEDMPPVYLEGDRYGYSKWKMEKIIKPYMSKLPIVIVRPPIVLGPGDSASLGLFKLPNLRIKLVLGGEMRYYSIIDVGDLCEGIYQSAVHPKASGEIFYFTAGDPVDLGTLQEIIRVKVFGKKCNSLLTVSVPPGFMLLAGSFLEIIGKLKKTTPFFNRSKMVEVKASGWTCSSEKAQKLIGWKSKHSVETTVERAGKWYIKQKML